MQANLCLLFNRHENAVIYTCKAIGHWWDKSSLCFGERHRITHWLAKNCFDKIKSRTMFFSTRFESDPYILKCSSLKYYQILNHDCLHIYIYIYIYIYLFICIHICIYIYKWALPSSRTTGLYNHPLCFHIHLMQSTINIDIANLRSDQIHRTCY